MGLGLAVSLPKEKVTVLGGAGSVLMNLGSLSTLARYRPPNLTHWIFGNESLLSVGGFPSATGTGTDLAGIAEKAGAQHVVLADTVEAAEQAFAEASEPDGLSVIVSKVEPFGPPSSRWISICSRTALSSRVTFRAWQAYCGCDWAILPLDFASPSIDMLGYRRQTRCELEKKGARHEFQWQQKTLS